MKYARKFQTKYGLRDQRHPGPWAVPKDFRQELNRLYRTRCRQMMRSRADHEWIFPRFRKNAKWLGW